IVGGRGGPKSIVLCAKWGDEYNTVFVGPDRCAELKPQLEEAFEREGRDRAEARLALMTGVIVGEDRDDLLRRADRVAGPRGDGDGHTPPPPKMLKQQRRRPAPPARRPRHFGGARSRVPQVLSVALIAIVMGLGAFFGLLLSHQKTVVVPEPVPTEAIRDAQGHLHVWGKVLAAPKGKVYWGAFRLGAPSKASLETSLEQEVESRPAVLMWYQE